MVEFLKLKQPVEVLNNFCEQQFHQIYFHNRFGNKGFALFRLMSAIHLTLLTCQSCLYFLSNAGSNSNQLILQ